MGLKLLLTKLRFMWDPRSSLAKSWLDSAESYEKTLRLNKMIDQQIVDSILIERSRIKTLFQKLLPEFKEQILVVVTNDTKAEHCAIFSWDKRIYVLVSAALIGRPIDDPNSNGTKSWDWLAHHEISHLKSGHLPWLFQIRRMFRLAIIFLIFSRLFSCVLHSNHLLDLLLNVSLWFFWIVWGIQLVVSLAFEYVADLQATRFIYDPLILDDVEKSLSRMVSQATKRFPQPFGWLNYLLHSLFFDPHPPFVFRQWLLRKHAQLLRTGLKKTISNHKEKA